jgi:phosphoglycerate dehydrogenase-like enzyme
VSSTPLTIVVLRENTEGLSMASYADVLRDRLPDHVIKHAQTPAEERALVADADVVTGIDIDETLLDEAPDLRLFASAFSGVDHLPLDALAERGVAVTNASGIHAPEIAEQVVGNVLVFTRRLHEGWRRQQRSEWRHFRSYELAESTVTVVGLGAIGQAVVQRLQGFEVETIGVRYTPSKGGPTDEVYGFDDIHEALAPADYVVVACPLTATTRGLLDESAFGTLSPNAVVVNVARGPVVDTDALLAALRTNDIRGAALDVTDPEPLPPDHPLWSLENCLITPHTGGHTPRHWDRLADIIAANVAVLETDGDLGGLQNLVLDPDGDTTR